MQALLWGVAPSCVPAAAAGPIQVSAAAAACRLALKVVSHPYDDVLAGANALGMVLFRGGKADEALQLFQPSQPSQPFYTYR